MRFTIEVENTKQKVLLVSTESTEFTALLKSHLEKYDTEVYLSPVLPDTIHMFSIIFLVNPTIDILGNLQAYRDKKCIAIFVGLDQKILHKRKQYIESMPNKSFKIIILKHQHLDQTQLERLLWFALSNDETKLLTLHTTPFKEEEPAEQKPETIAKLKVNSLHVLARIFQLRKLPFVLIGILLIAHILFIPPLLFANLFYYKTLQTLQIHNQDKQQLSMGGVAHSAYTFSKKMYAVVRPTYLFLSLANYPDSIFQTDDIIDNISQQEDPLYAEINETAHLFLKQNKSQAEVENVSALISKINNDLDIFQQNLRYLNPKIPDWTNSLKQTKQDISSTIAMIDTAKKILPHADNLFAKNTIINYVLLFENNQELRPGGGTIASVGLLQVENYSIKNFKVYDVRDADLRLKDTVEPPAPIKNYLQKENWSLKDSAFSPDYSENYQKALFFLQKELNIDNINGGVLITTSAIQNILASTGSVYIPEYSERVNQDNLDVKALLYSDQSAASGSAAKRPFISAVASQLFSGLNTINPMLFLEMIKKSFDEKQMVAYFDDQDLEKITNDLYWSGKVLTPACVQEDETCLIDYISSIDSNMGGNAVNPYIKKSISHKVVFTSNDQVTVKSIVLFKNEAQPGDPKGVYKDYFQLLLPKMSTIGSITKNDVAVDDYEVTEDAFKRLGLYFELQPQSQAEIAVTYTLNNQITQGKGNYQLIVQKQIGAPNSDFDLTIQLPKNLYTLNQNFSPLVKDNLILYNTSITSDKIFIVELLKENL